MATYLVEATEIRKAVISVEAESIKEAHDQVRHQYYDDTLKLDPEEFYMEGEQINDIQSRSYRSL